MKIMILETMNLVGEDPRYHEVYDADKRVKVAVVTSLNSENIVRCYCPDERGTLVYKAPVNLGDQNYHISKMKLAIEKYYYERDMEIVKRVTENVKRSGCLEPFEPRDIIDQKNEEIAGLKAEIERLTEERDFYKAPSSLLAKGIEQIKSEAIKEFWDRLSDNADTTQIDAFHSAYVIKGEDAENLLEEMTEVSK